MKSIVVALSSFVVGVVVITGCSGDPGEGTVMSAQDLVAKACHGVLPHVCKVCSDGQSQCAHWVVENGACEIEICPVPDVASAADASAPQCSTANDCTDPLPDLAETCPDGSTLTAHHVCNAGVCGVEVGTCSAPSSDGGVSGPSPTNQCQKAADCTGPLPKISEVCADGVTRSAHHVCKAGVCGIEICPSK